MPSDNTLTKGNLWHAIWLMSWPLVLTTVANSLVGLVDVQVAGSLDASAQAAVGLAEHVLFLFMLTIMSIGVGTTALVSRAYGTGNQEEYIKAAGQSFLLSIMLGLVMAFTASLTAQFAISLFTKNQAVVDAGRDYLTAYSFVLIPYSLTIIANAAFRAIGDSKTPLYIVACMTAINIAGDYLTVYYNFPVASLGIKLGIKGLAYAGLAGSIVGAALAFYFLKKSKLAPSLKALLPADSEMLKKICKIGIPSAMQRLFWALSVFVIFAVLTLCPNSVQALASWAVGMRVEALVFMPLVALSLAVSSIVGQNLGAREFERAYAAGWRVTGIGIAMMFAAALVLYMGADLIASAMTSEPVAKTYTVSYLKINALAEPFLALAMVLGGALQGAGETRTPMLLTLLTNWLIRIPLSYALAISFHMGVNGVWWSMAISILIHGLLMALRYQSKEWLKEKI